MGAGLRLVDLLERFEATEAGEAGAAAGLLERVRDTLAFFGVALSATAALGERARFALGDAVRLAGDAARFAGDAARDAARFAGDAARFAGDATLFAGDATRFAGDRRAGLFFVVVARFFLLLFFGAGEDGSVTSSSISISTAAREDFFVVRFFLFVVGMATSSSSSASSTGMATPRRVERFLPAGDFDARRAAGDATRFDETRFVDGARRAGDAATLARFFRDVEFSLMGATAAGGATAADGNTLARDREARVLIEKERQATGNRGRGVDSN